MTTTRFHLPSSVALLGAALLATAAAGQPLPDAGAAPASASVSHGAAADDQAPALLLRAQSALRGGQARLANDLLEQAETRLLAGVEPTRPSGGDPAFHIAEARRALASRDRAEAMRHTNMAIATVRDEGGATGVGADATGGRMATEGGGPAMVDSGMGTLPGSAGRNTGRAVVRDSGVATTSVARAEGIVLAQSRNSGTRAAPPPTGLPPGDTLPGWSGPRSGGTGPGTAAQPPGGFGTPDPSLGSTARSGGFVTGAPNVTAGPSSSSAIGGEAGRIGGAPPSDTTRSPGSSGIGGAGIGGSGVGGPLR